MFTFLSAPQALTKTFTQTPAGVVSTAYPKAFEFTSKTADHPTLASLEHALRSYAARGFCLLKGNVSRPLVSESRAGSTDPTAPTDWICLDVDGVDLASPDEFMQAIGLGDVSYIAQLSASYKITSPLLRAHLFVMLDKPYAPARLKQWLIDLNLRTPVLRDALTLTKTGHSLHWALDISTCQNDKLIYIAPPVLKGLESPVTYPRILAHHRARPVLALDTAVTADQNRAATNVVINALRAQAGMPAHKLPVKLHGSLEVLHGADPCQVTSLKTERGFTYFNLNGGDSWGYFHPDDNPEFIFNFKDEPAYLTRELLPAYWASLCDAGGRTDTTTGTTFLAFCDPRTGVYWRGTFDEGTRRLDLNRATGETQVRHFCKQYAVPLGDYIPEWRVEFDPQSAMRVDTGAKYLNLYEPPPLSRGYMPSRAPQVPPTTLKVLTHVLGGDTAVVDHFLNWLACILQHRVQTGTAWVLSGNEGTGKGVLMHHILRPLFAPGQTSVRRMESLTEVYNPYMKQCFLVFVDEMQARALVNSAAVTAKLRSFITEPTVPIREMHTNVYEVPNYTNWIFASNKPDAVVIPEGDRRHNVAGYQPDKIVLSTAEVEDLLPRELPRFFDYLMQHAADLSLARTVLKTDARDALVAIGESNVDTAVRAFLDGNFEFFVSQMPTTDDYKDSPLRVNEVEEYRRTLLALLARTTAPSGESKVSRDELLVLFSFSVGLDMKYRAPNRFTTLLKHHRVQIKPMRFGDRIARGAETTWKDVASWPEYLTSLTPARRLTPASLTKVK